MKNKRKGGFLCIIGLFLLTPCFLIAQEENESELLNQEELEKAFAYANPVVKTYAHLFGYNYSFTKGSNNTVKITNKEEKKTF